MQEYTANTGSSTGNSTSQTEAVSQNDSASLPPPPAPSAIDPMSSASMASMAAPTTTEVATMEVVTSAGGMGIAGDSEAVEGNGEAIGRHALLILALFFVLNAAISPLADLICVQLHAHCECVPVPLLSRHTNHSLPLSLALLLPDAVIWSALLSPPDSSAPPSSSSLLDPLYQFEHTVKFARHCASLYGAYRPVHGMTHTVWPFRTEPTEPTGRDGVWCQ